MRSTPAAKKNLSIAYEAWKNCPQYNAEKVIIGAAAENGLKSEITGATVVTNVKATIKPRGYTLYVPGDTGYKLDGDTLLPLAQRAAPLTSSQIQIINEALQRSKLAAELARNAMITVSKKSALGVTKSTNEQLYVDIFGAYDQTRATTVRKNYDSIVSALTNPVVHDHRSTSFFNTVGEGYAATHSGNVTVNVDLWLGRDFFADRYHKKFQGRNAKSIDSVKAKTDAYNTATDSTVGTLVHEFAHASINAVDCPEIVKVGGVDRFYTNPNAGYSSPNNNRQASGEDQVTRLAKLEPRAAIVSADCYGVFAAKVLTNATK